MSQGDMYDPRGGGVPLQKGIHGKYVLNWGMVNGEWQQNKWWQKPPPEVTIQTE